MSNHEDLRRKLDGLKGNKGEGQETPWPIPTSSNGDDREDLRSGPVDDDLYLTPDDIGLNK